MSDKHSFSHLLWSWRHHLPFLPAMFCAPASAFTSSATRWLGTEPSPQSPSQGPLYPGICFTTEFCLQEVLFKSVWHCHLYILNHGSLCHVKPSESWKPPRKSKDDESPLRLCELSVTPASKSGEHSHCDVHIGHFWGYVNPFQIHVILQKHLSHLSIGRT